MRIITTMVVKNEADRYLNACLVWAKTFSDVITVYDDQSTDDTVDVCIARGALAAVRPDGVPSFLEHEGRFREEGWRWMERAAEPEEGDWIFSLDADELLVDPRGELRGILDDIQAAASFSADTIAYSIPEIFAEAGNLLYRRVDGYWGSISGARLTAWKPGAKFADRRMASGSLPVGGPQFLSPSASLLHLGYLGALDKRAKHDRYVSLPGHSSEHVRSILAPGRLEAWDGPLPFRVEDISTPEDR